MTTQAIQIGQQYEWDDRSGLKPESKARGKVHFCEVRGIFDDCACLWITRSQRSDGEWFEVAPYTHHILFDELLRTATLVHESARKPLHESTATA